MRDGTKIFICEILEEEAWRSLALEGLEYVEVITYRTEGVDVQESMDDLRAKIEATIKPWDIVCVFCPERYVSKLKAPRGARAYTYTTYRTCLDLVVGPGGMEMLLAEGAHILTPGMLKRWRDLFRSPGTDAQGGEASASDAKSSVVLLDTGVGGDLGRELEELSAYLGKPHRTLVVGLDFIRLKLSNAVLNARIHREAEMAKEKVRAQERLRSEYAMAFDLMERISQGQEEEQVVGSILDVLQMLFSPAEMDYYGLYPSDEVRIFGYDKGTFEPARSELASSLLKDTNTWDEASGGFKLKVENKRRPLGVAVLRRLSFPEFRKDYLSLASQLSSVFGLAIANSRAFTSLKESEAQVERAFALERTMLSISQDFFARQDFDKATMDALARVGEALGLSRGQLLLFSKDMKVLSCAHEWTAPGVPPSKDRLSDIGPATKEWLMDNLQTGGAVRVVTFPCLDEKGRAQLAPFGDTGASAMAMALVTVEGRRQGIVCLQHLGGKDAWDSDETNMLSFLARKIGYALERRRTQENLALLAESVTMSNKVLRHDIRNELMVLAGSLQLYDMKKEERHLERAKRSSDRLTEILDHFKELDNFLQSSQATFSVDLRETIAKAMAPYQMPYQVVGDGQVQADFAIDSVLDNLIRNSRRHGEAKQMEFRITSNGTFLELAVADDGKGLPPEARGRLFQEGFSYGERRSTGLGLFWIKKTMDRYGGWVKLADSEKGATFVLGFPLD
jgi:anti-sigma regulatory factor (Ser/Thr protein kinase)